MSEKSGNTYGFVPYEVPTRNPEGLSPYEEAMRDKYMGDNYDEGDAWASLEAENDSFNPQEVLEANGWTVATSRTNKRTGQEEYLVTRPDPTDHHRKTSRLFTESQIQSMAEDETRAEAADATDTATEKEKADKQSKLIEALKEAYGKGNPDEVKKIKAALNELNQQPAGSKNQGGEIGKKPSTPEAAGPAPAPTAEDYLAVGETPPAEAASAAPESADQKEELKLLGESLQKVRKEYAAARVDVESHFFKKFFGGKDRQQRLEDLTAQLKGFELAVAKLKLAPEIEKLKSLKEGGEEYAQQQEQLAQVMAAHAFEGLQETERLTAEAYDHMVEGRSKFSKLAAKAGRWFTKGGKLSQVLRTGGTGAVAGAVTASVATWPITTAVGLAGGLAVAGAVKQKVLEENLGEDRVDTSSNYQEAWSKALHEASGDKDSTSTQMEAMIEATTDGMNESSKARQEALRKKVRSSMGKFALGFGAGVAAANIMQSTVFGAESGSKTIVSEVGANSSAEGLPSNGGAQAGAELGYQAADPVDFVNAESLSNVGDYQYPWDWAAQEVGPENAMDYLRELGNKAAEAGHSVEWTTLPDGTEMVSVDGTTGTADVLDVLNRFK